MAKKKDSKKDAYVIHIKVTDELLKRINKQRAELGHTIGGYAKYMLDKNVPA